MSTRRIARTIAAECLGMRARRLSRAVTRVYDQELRPHAVGIAQLNLLVALGSAGSLRAADLSSALDIEKSTLSRTLARLSEQGLITADADLRISLTAQGEDLLARIAPAWRRAQARARSLLGERLARSLQKMPG